MFGYTYRFKLTLFKLDFYFGKACHLANVITIGSQYSAFLDCQDEFNGEPTRNGHNLPEMTLHNDVGN